MNVGYVPITEVFYVKTLRAVDSDRRVEDLRCYNVEPEIKFIHIPEHSVEFRPIT